MGEFTPLAALVFVLALIGGTGCSIVSKLLYGQTGTDAHGTEGVPFTKPIFQTLAMFVAMSFALFIHYGSVFYRRWQRSRSGHQPLKQSDGSSSSAAEDEDSLTVPLKTIILLGAPALCDVVATALTYVGLLYVTTSVYQLLKSAIIVFVAVEKVVFLKTDLRGHQWFGIASICAAVVCVGLSSVYGSTESATSTEGSPVVGMMILLCGVCIQSFQYVIEEFAMTRSDAAPAPPMVIVAAEGIWGVIMCFVILYPVAGMLPGTDDGCYETFANGWSIVQSSPAIQHLLVIYGACILFLNVFGVLITYLSSSLLKAILDSLRPVTVWLTDLAIFYVFTAGTFGEEWTVWGWLQLCGLCGIIVGTSIYNGNITLSFFSYDDDDEDADAGFTVPRDLASPALMTSPMQRAALERRTPGASKKKRRAGSGDYGAITAAP